jgi:hypothetical protein
MPRIVVDCQSDGWPGQDAEILVDGRERAKIGRNERADLPIDVGSHVLQARVGRTTSQPLYFRIQERETIGFDCLVAGAWRKRVTLRQSYRRQSDERFSAHDLASPDYAPGPRGDGA